MPCYLKSNTKVCKHYLFRLCIKDLKLIEKDTENDEISD